jgi:hypothetical protein
MITKERTDVGPGRAGCGSLLLFWLVFILIIALSYGC